MDNQKLIEYRQDLRAAKPLEELLQDTNELLQGIQVVKKKKAYIPPYARCKLSCIFHNGWRKVFYSYDYDPREHLDNEDSERILDEGRGLRALMELATSYHNADRLNLATIFVNLEEIPYTGNESFNLPLARWGARVDTVKHPWKLITAEDPPLQTKPVYARVRAVLDLEHLFRLELERREEKEEADRIAAHGL